jgi:hypothetical protein
MLIKVPTVERKLVDGKPVKEFKDLVLEVDTSFKAHWKWEQYFAKDEGVDLNTYTQRIEKLIDSGNVAPKNMIDILKLLFCFVNSEKLPTFEKFLGMFDLEVADEILNKINDVLKEVGSTVSKN